MSALGLAHATVGAKARFAFYWIVSIGLVANANAIWPEPPDFNAICNYGRRAASGFFGVPPATTSLEGVEFAECAIRRRGEGFAVTIGKVSQPQSGNGTEITHFNAIVYPNGTVHHIELIRRDPRADTGPNVQTR
jgi:hypothetical protein